MRRELVLACLSSSGLAAADIKHIEHPGEALSVSIDFRKGHDQDVAVGLTFGMAITHDGGATWRWMCEKALHYGFPILPEYAFARSGALYCGSHGGLIVNRDGCSFEQTANGLTFMSTVTLGPDDAVYAAASDLSDGRIYKSTDDGATFPTSVMPAQLGDWWTSIEVAPSDAQRVYLAGYRVGSPRTFLLFRSDDGGASFQPMSASGLTTSVDSEIFVGGIGHTDPDTLYLRVTYQIEDAVSDAIFRSIDGGQSWSKVFMRNAGLAFILRANGDLVVSGVNVGTHRSTDGGDTWTELVDATTLGCFAESSADELWACTNNYGPADAAVMKTTDFTQWTKVLRFQDIAGPADCPAGTIQQDVCVEDPAEWCVLRADRGITANPTGCVFPVPEPDGLLVDIPCEGCCCQADQGPPGPAAVAIGGAIGMVVLRRRRRGT
jgi:uncharacterized protein (TIGR03382 family)